MCSTEDETTAHGSEQATPGTLAAERSSTAPEIRSYQFSDTQDLELTRQLHLKAETGRTAVREDTILAKGTAA